MIAGYENKRLKLNSDLGIYKKGSSVNATFGPDDQPVSPYWRKRLEESKKDNCLEIVKRPKKTVKNKAKADKEV